MTPTPIPKPSAALAQTAALPPRSPWVDVAKGLLMVLVVYGHMQAGLSTSGILNDWPGWSWSYHVIYAFHMPAFILLSGLFIERSLRVGLRAFAIEKLKSLYYPRVLWSLIVFGAIVAATRVSGDLINSRSAGGFPWTVFFDPGGAFWFLMTLFYLSVAYAGLRALGVPRIPICIVCILAMLAVPELRDRWTPPWNDDVQKRVLHVLWYSGWLALGVLFSRQLLAPELGRSAAHRAGLAALAVGGFALVALQIPWNITGDPVFFLRWTAPGVVAALAVSMLIASFHRSGRVTALSAPAAVCAYLGRRSLEIYLVGGLATIAMRIVLKRFLHTADPTLHITLGLLAGLICPIVFAIILERIGFQYAFRFGPAPRARHAAPGAN